MNKELFISWLEKVKEYKKTTIQDRVSNVKKIALHHGDLDQHFKKDKGAELFELLTYTKQEYRENIACKHNIPISGDLYDGTSSYRQALRLYMEFKKHEIENNRSNE